MFHQIATEKSLKDLNKGTLAENLGIEILEYGDGFIKGKMPVDERTIQPFGILHGGASVAFAETLGSVASFMLVAEGKQVVGLEINANHIRSAKSGKVIGVAKIIHKGNATHVWEVEVKDEQDRLISKGRLTMMIMQKDGK